MRNHLLLLLLSLSACTPRPGSVSPGIGIVDSVLSRLSIRERAAQLLMPRLPGSYTGFDTHAFAHIRSWVDTLRVGGVIASTGSPVDVALRLNELQNRSRIPLLVGSDLEGGTAFRLPGGTGFPTNMGVAATARPDDAYTMGWITAEEARAVGIHLAFAPVADVNSNPDNPIINTRSFGADPATVSQFVAAAVRGMEDHGLFATAKHFPGHGDTETDTHLGLPIVARLWPDLDRVELPPFRSAIRQGVSGIMSAHIAIPSLDPTEAPATLSNSLLRGILRDSLGFEGLIVTDALDMAALAGPLDRGEIAVRAFLAGADLLLMPPDPREALEALVAAVDSGRIPEERLNESVRRILRLKERAGLFRHRLVDLTRIGNAVGRQAHLDAARAVTGRSLVLVSQRNEAVSRLRVDPSPISLITYTDQPDRTFGTTLQRALQSQGRTVRRLRLHAESGDSTYRQLGDELTRTSRVILAVDVRARAGGGRLSVALPLIDTISAASRRGVEVHLLSFGSPYVASEFAALTSYLVAWTANPTTEQAVADALDGSPVSGRLPIPIPNVAPMDQGIDLPDRTWAPLDRLLDSAVIEGAIPGAVVGISLKGIRHTYGTGRFGRDDATRPGERTMYDLASLTKVIGLTPLVMYLVDSGQVELDAPVVRYLPAFSGGQKDRVTIRHLLTHSSGLPAWKPFFREASTRDDLLRSVESTPLEAEPGSRTAYSDLGIILLTEIVERQLGSLPGAFRRWVREPLGLASTMFTPAAALRYRIPPTEYDSWRGRMIRGEVHDENAFRMDGVSGHAGLFGSAEDLLTFGEWILRGISPAFACAGRSIAACTAPAPPSVISEFARRQTLVAGSTRALGWDTPGEDPGASAGGRLSPRSIGHTGFTGTSIWIDPDRDLVIVLLSNRVHPTRENPRIGPLRAAVADLAAALADRRLADAR